MLSLIASFFKDKLQRPHILLNAKFSHAIKQAALHLILKALHQEQQDFKTVDRLIRHRAELILNERYCKKA